MTTIERRYDGESDWEEVDIEEAKDILAGYYRDVSLAIDYIMDGKTLRTFAAFYRKKRKG